MTVDQLNKRLRWLVFETVRLQRKLAYASVGAHPPDRVEQAPETAPAPALGA